MCVCVCKRENCVYVYVCVCERERGREREEREREKIMNPAHSLEGRPLTGTLKFISGYSQENSGCFVKF